MFIYLLHHCIDTQVNVINQLLKDAVPEFALRNSMLLLLLHKNYVPGGCMGSGLCFYRDSVDIHTIT